MFKSFPYKQYNCLLSMFSWRRNISSCCIHAILHWIFYIIQILSCVMSLMYHMQEKCTKNQLNRENVRLHQRTGSRCYIAQAHVVVRNETIWKKAVRSVLDKWKTDGKCDWHWQCVSCLVCRCCSCHPSHFHLIVGDVTVMYLNSQLTDKAKPTGRRAWVRAVYWEQPDFKVC